MMVNTERRISKVSVILVIFILNLFTRYTARVFAFNPIPAGGRWGQFDTPL